MIYQFKCSCVESQPFELLVDVDSDHSFFDLHCALQSSLGFQPLYLASFMIPFSRGRREIEISQLDTGERKSFFRSMHRTMIGELMLQGRKFIRYVFDLLNDRYLLLELTGIIMEKNLREPLVRLNHGKNPVQVLDDVMADELPEDTEKAKTDSDYGVLADYYEIFGEMEEYVM